MIKTAKVVESIQDNGGFIRTDEVAGRAEYEHIRKAIEDGTLVRVRQGVYAEQLALANTMIDVEKIVPGGVVCLYSAWSHYQLSTQIPSGHCICQSQLFCIYPLTHSYECTIFNSLSDMLILSTTSNFICSDEASIVLYRFYHFCRLYHIRSIIRRCKDSIILLNHQEFM